MNVVSIEQKGKVTWVHVEDKKGGKHVIKAWSSGEVPKVGDTINPSDTEEKTSEYQGKQTTERWLKQAKSKAFGGGAGRPPAPRADEASIAAQVILKAVAEQLLADMLQKTAPDLEARVNELTEAFSGCYAAAYAKAKSVHGSA